MTPQTETRLLRFLLVIISVAAIIWGAYGLVKLI